MSSPTNRSEQKEKLMAAQQEEKEIERDCRHGL